VAFSPLPDVEKIIELNFLKLVLAKDILMCYYFTCWLWNKSLLVRHHLTVYAIHNQLFFYTIRKFFQFNFPLDPSLYFSSPLGRSEGRQEKK
jgi:hypothetical protein